MFGMQLKLVVPRAQVVYLRRCIQAVSRISSEDSTLLQTSQLNETPASSDRKAELSRQPVTALKELCKSYGIRTGGSFSSFF